MNVKDKLDRHIEETYHEEVYCMVPDGMEACVMGTELTNSEIDLDYCTECEHRTKADRKKDAVRHCERCDKETKHDTVTLPIVRCIMSEYRVLMHLKERISKDLGITDEKKLADEVYSEYCQNTTGGYYGPETPLFVDEFQDEEEK